jgi:hypothetical protein
MRTGSRRASEGDIAKRIASQINRLYGTELNLRDHSKGRGCRGYRAHLANRRSGWTTPAIHESRVTKAGREMEYHCNRRRLEFG